MDQGASFGPPSHPGNPLLRYEEIRAESPHLPSSTIFDIVKLEHKILELREEVRGRLSGTLSLTSSQFELLIDRTCELVQYYLEAVACRESTSRDFSCATRHPVIFDPILSKDSTMGDLIEEGDHSRPDYVWTLDFAPFLTGIIERIKGTLPDAPVIGAAVLMEIQTAKHTSAPLLKNLCSNETISFTQFETEARHRTTTSFFFSAIIDEDWEEDAEEQKTNDSTQSPIINLEEELDLAATHDRQKQRHYEYAAARLEELFMQPLPLITMMERQLLGNPEQLYLELAAAHRAEDPSSRRLIARALLASRLCQPNWSSTDEEIDFLVRSAKNRLAIDERQHAKLRIQAIDTSGLGELMRHYEHRERWNRYSIDALLLNRDWLIQFYSNG